MEEIFFGGEDFLFVSEVDDDMGLVSFLGDDFEGPVFHVTLDCLVAELSSDQTLGVENCVGGVHGDLIFGSISN